ncbi:hypothetical protein KFE25_009045 [Diacronema lutheri]|uniref:Gamma-glutamyltransferase n=1 Tax=Diacronema lutheri TaxID=2081491 RepID=A0A8J5XU46_DIALT|nr:hypothetical protein KFE25_009045 [Diacronema lutheri]
MSIGVGLPIALCSASAFVAVVATLRRRARRRATRARVRWVSASPTSGARRAEPGAWSPATPREAPFARSPSLASGCMVACSQPLAAQAGLEILQMGGNAVDAAIAVAAALAVLEPGSNGIGGDFFMLVYCRKSGSVAALNGSGRSPAALTLARAREDCHLSPKAPCLPPLHAHTVTVPGAVAAWCDAVEALGSGVVSLRELLARATTLAARGFPVAPVAAYYWRAAEQLLRNASPHGRTLLRADGRAPAEGEVFVRKELALVLLAIARRGRAAFYEGRIARAIVSAVRDAGGCMSLADLAAHEGTFTEPVCADYYGARVWEHPPNGGGVTVLLALNILRVLEEDGTIPAWPAADDELPAPLEAALVHAQIEALRLAFADTAHYLGDPEAEHVPTATLLSEQYARQRAALFQPGRASPDLPRGAPREDSCTVSWQVVDHEGNAVSAVQSNYQGFGTGIVPESCGFTLQNRGLNFSTLDGVPNGLAPAKRPYHTILPCVLTDAASGELVASLSNMGGFMQPQGHVQLICRLVRRGLCPQHAVDMPRFCILPVHAGTSPCSPVVAVEAGFRPAVVARLRALGHAVNVVDGYERTVVGRAQVIVRASNGVLWGGSDGRADGLAAGLNS